MAIDDRKAISKFTVLETEGIRNEQTIAQVEALYLQFVPSNG